MEAVQKAEEFQPDLILLDIGLPKLNGIESAKRVRATASGTRILFLSQESSPEVVDEAFRLGARGYVLKSCAGRELLRAIEAVLRGGLFVSSALDFGDTSYGCDLSPGGATGDQKGVV